MKKIISLILLIFCFNLIGCCSNNMNNSTTKTDDIIIKTDEKEEDDNLLKMYIDGKEININWEMNASIDALKELGNLTINMHRYGGFEQVGPIGKSIISNDIYMNTSPGDVVLYSSNQIVIFFGTNTWSYTKLGHINLSENELEQLLDKENVVVRIGE